METVNVIIRKETESERQKRILHTLDNLFNERAKKEAERRKIWVLEEEERRRRIKEQGKPLDTTKQHTEDLKEQAQEELMHHVSHIETTVAEEKERVRRMMPEFADSYAAAILHEVDAIETRMLEERERKNRLQQQKDLEERLSKFGSGTKPETDEQKSEYKKFQDEQKQANLHEKVQDEFMSKVHRRQLAQAEEAERARRIIEQTIEERKVQWWEDFQREMNWAKTIILEESERERRIVEEYKTEVMEEVEREILRRQTWIAEEAERRRRIMQLVHEDMEEAQHRELHLREVLHLEEQERTRRELEERKDKQAIKDEINGKELVDHNRVQDVLSKEDKLIQIQEEFMSKLHRKEAAELEKEEEKRISVEELFDEAIQSEIDRRVTWFLEERERRRRIIEDAYRDYHDHLARQTTLVQVHQLEEEERMRRIRSEKTKSEEYKIHTDNDKKEMVQEEMMSKVHRKQLDRQEEIERFRRVEREHEEVANEDKKHEFESKIMRKITHEMEEQERDRRIAEELHKSFEESIEREMNRRKSWVEEENERIRRINESKGSIIKEPVSDIMKKVLENINIKVAKSSDLKPSKIHEDTFINWLKQ